MKRDRTRPHTSLAAMARLPLFTLAVMLCGSLASPKVVLASAGGFAMGRSHAGSGVGFGYSVSGSSGDRRDFQYALIKRGHETFCSLDGDNHSRALGTLQDEVERTRHEVFYFAIDDREYVIRDEKAVERVHEIVEPVSRLGAEQGRLGGMQGELGRRQGELGQLQGEVAEVQAHLASLEARDDPRHRTELDELRQEIRGLFEQVRLLSARQRELGAQQQELGRRQRELGEQQRRASLLAFDQLRSLADKAIASGTAEAIPSD